MNADPFSFGRTGVIAVNTLREATRQRLFGGFLALAFALVVGLRWLGEFNFGAPELKFIADCGFGVMASFGAVLAIAATAQLFLGGIENRTALAVLAKPVRRDEFVFGYFAGILGLLAMFCVLLTGVLAAVLWSREAALREAFPAEFPAASAAGFASLWAAGFLQWLKLAVLSAFVLLIASFAQTQLFATIAGCFVFVICHLQHLAGEAYARSGPSFGRFATATLASAFPNFHLFSFADPLAVAGGTPGAHLARVTFYGLGYLAVACAVAAASFRRREL